MLGKKSTEHLLNNRIHGAFSLDEREKEKSFSLVERKMIDQLL